MSEIKAPFLTVNPKSYLYGDKSLELALARRWRQIKPRRRPGYQFILPVLLRIFV